MGEENDTVPAVGTSAWMDSGAAQPTNERKKKTNAIADGSIL